MGCLFLYKNHWAMGTVSSDSEQTGFAAINTQDSVYTKTWRSADAASAHWLLCDRGAITEAVKFFIMKFNNLSATAVVKLQANDTNSWDTPAVDVTLTVYKDITAYRFSSEQAYRYWRILITDTSNPDGYYEVGYVYLGNELAVSKNVTYGFVYQYDDLSRMTTNEQGFVTGYVKGKTVRTEYSINFLSSTEAQKLDAFFRAVGYSTYWFFVEDETAIPSSVFFCRAAGFKLKFVFNNFWELQFDIERVL